MLVKRPENGFVFAGPPNAHTWEDIPIAVMALGPRKEVLQVSPG